VALPWSGNHTFVGNVPVSQNTFSMNAAQHREIACAIIVDTCGRFCFSDATKQRLIAFTVTTEEPPPCRAPAAI
jgi:hypothetical protein